MISNKPTTPASGIVNNNVTPSVRKNVQFRTPTTSSNKKKIKKNISKTSSQNKRIKHSGYRQSFFSSHSSSKIKESATSSYDRFIPNRQAMDMAETSARLLEFDLEDSDSVNTSEKSEFKKLFDIVLGSQGDRVLPFQNTPQKVLLFFINIIFVICLFLSVMTV